MKKTQRTPGPMLPRGNWKKGIKVLEGGGQIFINLPFFFSAPCSGSQKNFRRAIVGISQEDV